MPPRLTLHHEIGFTTRVVSTSIKSKLTVIHHFTSKSSFSITAAILVVLLYNLAQTTSQPLSSDQANLMHRFFSSFYATYLISWSFSPNRLIVDEASSDDNSGK
jgi:hypothetical protein